MPGSLDGLVDYGQEPGVEGVEVQLVPEADREPLDDLGGVVAAAV